MPTQLDRIENGMRWLVKRVGFPTRNAWDGLKGDELRDAAARQERAIDDMVENIMDTGEPYEWGKR